MKKMFFTTAISLLISLFSVAQKLVLKSIKVKEFYAFNGNRDSTFNIFNVDSQGYKQGPFQYIYKNQVLVKGNYKNDILIDSCFWYNTEGKLFVKGNFVYKNDYNRIIGFIMIQYSRNYFAYLDDTIIIYNHPSDRSTPSVLIYKNNLKDGVFKINSKDGFQNVFTYKQDTLHGYFRNTFVSNPNKYSREIVFEKGNYWNGANSYDGWYHKYEIKNDDTILIQKTLYNKNAKLESYTYYKTSGKKECLYFYSKGGVIDSIRCVHEGGNLKSIIHYDSNEEGIQYTYNEDGQLIKKASYTREQINGYVFEYSNNFIEKKTLYKYDTLITKELITNNTIVWQRVFYKNNEVEKVDWFNNKGGYMNTTCCELSSNEPRNLSVRRNGTPVEIYKEEEPLVKVNYAEKRADLVLYTPFPVGHQFYSKNNFSYSNTFVVSKNENNIFRPNEYYKYVLNRIQDSLTVYAKTEEGKAFSKLKAPITIVVSLSLLKSDATKGFASVRLNQIVDGKNKKINKAIENFFVNRSIPYTFPYFENQYIECIYTIYPN